MGLLGKMASPLFWKVGFFAASAVAIGSLAWLGPKAFDQSLRLDLAGANHKSSEDQLFLMSSLAERAYVGMPKADFIEVIKKIRPTAQIKDDPPVVFVDDLAFEFDANGKFARNIGWQ